MNIKIIQFCIPGFIKKKKLKELFRLTADAFQTETPKLRGLSFRGCLSEYALFTREQAGHCLRGGCSSENVRSRLYKNSFEFGRNLRKNLHIMTWEESVAALQIVYRMIGINFRYGGQVGFAAGRDGSAAGREASGNEGYYFSIGQCYFSGYYSADVCRLISALDEGLAAGLSGGGRLCFHQRITEGGSCCRGCIRRHMADDMAGQ